MRAHRKLWIGLAVAAVVALVVVVAVLRGGDDPQPPLGFVSPSEASVYVALGDSYSAGEGTAPYLEGTDDSRAPGARYYDSCHRSKLAYSRLVAADLALSPQFLACSGAKSGNIGWLDENGSIQGNPQFPRSSLVPTTQLKALTTIAADNDVSLVTISVGGNDLGFANILGDCANPRGSCVNAPPGDWTGRDGAGPPNNARFPYSDYAPRAIDWTRPRIRRVFDSLQRLVPNARILVVGYPRLFPVDQHEQDCQLLKRLWTPGDDRHPGEQDFLNDQDAIFNTMISQEAAAAGLEFVAIADAFSHHEPCGSRDDWLRGPIWPGGDNSQTRFSRAPGRGSFHPNAAGHQAMARAVLTVLGNATPVDVVATQADDTTTPTIAAIGLGQGRAEVEQIAGGAGIHSPTPGMVRYLDPPILVDYGVRVERPSDRVRAVSTTSRGARTEAGVGVGSTIDELQAAYPKIAIEDGHTAWLVGKAHTEDRGLRHDTRFTLHDGRITRITIIARPPPMPAKG